MKAMRKKQCFMVGIMICIFALSSLIMTQKAEAGQINSAEAGLISTVSGKFEYNGATYQVKDSYIAQGKQKLSQDNVDLTAAEANSYKGQFQQSYAELVEEGYCNKIGGSTKQATPTARKLDKNKKKMLEELLGKPQSPKEKKTKDTKTKSITTQSPQPTETTDTEELWSEEEEDLGEKLDITGKDIKYAKNGKLSIRADQNKISITEQEEKKTSQNVIGDILKLSYVRTGLIILSACTVVLIGAIGGYIGKYTHKKKKKRKLRGALAVIAGVVLAGWGIMLLLTLGLKLGVFSKDIIHREMMESNYYSGVTQVLRKESENVLDKYHCPKALSTDAIKLADVYIEGKQYVDKVMDGEKKVKVNTSRIDKSVEQALKSYEESKGSSLDSQNRKQIKKEILSAYTTLLTFSFGKDIVKAKKEFMPLFYISIIVGILSVLAIMGIVYKMYGYPHKAVRVAGYGILSSSVFMGVAALLAMIKIVHTTFTISPIYYRDFLVKYITRDIKVFLYLAIVGVLLGVVLFIWKKYLHMEYAE